MVRLWRADTHQTMQCTFLAAEVYVHSLCPVKDAEVAFCRQLPCQRLIGHVADVFVLRICGMMHTEAHTKKVDLGLQ